MKINRNKCHNFKSPTQSKGGFGPGEDKGKELLQVEGPEAGQW